MCETKACDFHRDGAQFYPSALLASDLADLRTLTDRLPQYRGGTRLFGDKRLTQILQPSGSIGNIAVKIQGNRTQAVRAVLFNKSPEANWMVPWHQDRTIVVQHRRDTEGFGPWSFKTGLQHVEPPFEILSRMITIRIHLDDCDTDNAPLLIAPGSHKLGRITADKAAKFAKRTGPVACIAMAGDVWIYSTPILHASERAKRPRQRRVLQIDYANFDLPSGLAWLGVTSKNPV